MRVWSEARVVKPRKSARSRGAVRLISSTESMDNGVKLYAVDEEEEEEED